ncbi:hypothetical protein [Pseudofulvibacter geojedonensis]|uniref:Uncharacterized protein n=1 Tax=Pseudofulvibacter geojedonensis TaxID=1123758 RepID=A0ABW3I1J3_9FLAO
MMETELICKVHKGFTSLWWDEFVSNTGNLEEHYVVESGLSEKEIENLNVVIEDVLKKAIKDKKNQDYLGVWKNGKQEARQIEFLSDNPIGQQEGVKEWKERVLKNDKLGLILNNAESHSDELSNIIMKYMSPYIEKYGFPVNGINTTIVAGDNEWDSLGIHKSSKGTYSLQINLSDFVKEAYVWTDEKIKELGFNGEVISENFKEFIKNYSDKYSFSKGEIYSMSGNYAHTEKNNGFSVGLIIDINRLTEKELINNLWFKLGNELFSKNFTGDKATILPSYQEENHSEYIKKLLKGIRYRNIDTNQSIQDALRICFLEHKLSLASNQGLQTPPVVNTNTSYQEFKKALVNKSIVAANNCKILCYEEKEHLYLFIRGRKFKMMQSEGVISIIKTLNEGECLSYSTLKENFFNGWGDEPVLMFLHLLFKNKGVKLQLSK